MSSQPPPGQPPTNQPPPGQWGPPPQGPPAWGPPPQGPPPYGPPQPPYGPPQQPYGPPGGPPPRGRSKGVIVAIVVGVLVVVGGGVAAAILLLGGDEEASTSDPQDTVDSFFQAMRDADCEAVESLVTDRFLEASGECDPNDLGEQAEGMDLEVPQITEQSDESAVAEVSDDQATFQMRLVNEDGAWLIDEITAGASAPTDPEDADANSEADDGDGEVLDPELPTEADAQAMLESYVEAMRTGDCATIDELSSETLNSSTDCDGDIVPPSDVEVEYGAPTLVSTTAAEVPATIDGRQTTISLMLTQEGDGWKVAQLEVQ